MAQIAEPPPLTQRKLNKMKFLDKIYTQVGGPAARPPVTMHEGQQAFHSSTARFRTSVWGRRAGKSLSGATEVAPRMFSNHTDGYPHTIWVVCPNYELGEREFRVIWHQIIEKLGVPTEYQHYTRGPGGTMGFKTAWGAEVWVRSAERPDKALLGEGLSFVIMAEAARLERSIWEQYIEPALADRNGGAIFTSTPQGHNFLKTLHDRGQNPDHPDWDSYQFPSWVNEVRFPGGLRFLDADDSTREIQWERVAANPKIRVLPHPESNPKLVQSWQTLSRHYFWQEYGAQFRTMAGLVYPDFDRGFHVVEWEFSRLQGVRNYRTIDYGTTNPFVCLDIQVLPNGDVYVWREWRRIGYSTLDNVKWAIHPSNLGYRLDAVIGDPYEPDGRLTTENEWGIPAQFVTIGVKNGIELVERRLKLAPDANGLERPRLFIHPRCTGMIQEMQAYRWKNTLDEELYSDPDFITMQEDPNPKDEPLKANDHAPDALRNFLSWFEGDTLVHHAENDQAFNESLTDVDPYANASQRRWKEMQG